MKRLARLPWSAILPAVAGVAYGLSPVDLILDVIPLLGLADDVTAMLSLFTMAVIQFFRWRKRRREAPALPQPAASV